MEACSHGAHVTRNLRWGRALAVGARSGGGHPGSLAILGAPLKTNLSFQASQRSGNGSARVSGPKPTSWQCSGAAACSLPGEETILLTLASLPLTPLRPSAACSCPGAWCILLGATSGSEAVIHRSQVWDPFPSVWLGVASLGDRDTHAHTQRQQAQRDASRHTQTNTSTGAHSPSLLSLLPNSFLGSFPLSQHSFHK